MGGAAGIKKPPELVAREGHWHLVSDLQSASRAGGRRDRQAGARDLSYLIHDQILHVSTRFKWSVGSRVCAGCQLGLESCPCRFVLSRGLPMCKSVPFGSQT